MKPLDEKAWRELRRSGIGGSDAPAIMGVDQYRSALDIYRMKVGELEPDAPNAAMKRGTFLEPVARRLYRELTGRRVRQQQMRRHPLRPWMIANVDGQIVGDERGPGILEIKCPSLWSFAKIQREGLPLSYVIQVAHYMEVFGYTWASFALFSSEKWSMIFFDIPRDAELAEALLVKEQQFWSQFVEKRVPPPEQPDTTPELMAQLAKAQEAIGGGELIVRNDGEWAMGATMYLEAKEIAETAENLKESATAKLKALMGQPGAVEGAGIRVYWSEREGRVTFDRKAVEKAQPLDRALTLTALAHAAEARGIASVDTLFISEKLKQAALDLAQFEKQGKPYQDFRVYPVKAGIGD